MPIELTRAECRDLLHGLDRANIEPELLAKIELGAQVVAADPLVTITIAGYGERQMRKSEVDAMFGNVAVGVSPTTVPPFLSAITVVPTTDIPRSINPMLERLYPIDATLNQVPQYTPITMEPKLQKAGVTQADIDQWNNARRQVFETNAKLRLRTPVLDLDAPPDTQEFAQPDVVVLNTGTRYNIGDTNAAGDKCVGYDAGGASVFSCKSGHGYTPSAVVQGCPRCFMSGAGGGGSNGPIQDRDAVAGAEPF